MKQEIIILLALSMAFLGCAKTEVSKEEGLSIEDALSLAINDEYKARATYKKVIGKFGEIRPFTNIVQAEEMHINLLLDIYDQTGFEVPADEWKDRVPEFDSVAEACEAGAQAEIENAALYDSMLDSIHDKEIIDTFTTLRDASRNNHLPAFQRCSR